MRSIKKQKKSEFRDAQILLAVRELKYSTIMDILYYCIDKYPVFDWNYFNIRNSIVRLEKSKKINVCPKNEISDFNINNKTFMRNQLKLFIHMRDA